MKRPIAIVGAPTSLGIRPYDEGGPRRLDLAPGVLRERGLVARLGARDEGDLAAPVYVDHERPGTRPRNEAAVVDYSRSLARRVAEASRDGAFVLVLGGDCSVVLGGLLGLRRPDRQRLGLVYVDAHADFATPEESTTGSAASMCLAMAVGRGETPLARLRGGAGLVEPRDVVLVGRRDHDEAWYGHDALRASEVLDLSDRAIRDREPGEIAGAALDRLAETDGFWIHLDADALDPVEVPAVDSPLPNGLSTEQAAELLRPLVEDPGALGLELTIYDPALDPDVASAAALAGLLEEVLAR